MELDNFLTDLKQTKDWLQRVEGRVMVLEDRQKRDGSTIVSLQQDILRLAQTLKAFDPVFLNINMRLDAHGSAIASNKAGLDTVLVQLTPKQTQPKYKIWPFT